jgi:hypothetical protein
VRDVDVYEYVYESEKVEVLRQSPLRERGRVRGSDAFEPHLCPAGRGGRYRTKIGQQRACASLGLDDHLDLPLSTSAFAESDGRH